MNEVEFWAIIDLLDWEHTGNDDKVLEPAIKRTRNQVEKGDLLFCRSLCVFALSIDTKAHASNIGDDAYDSTSELCFSRWIFYARCVVLANGKKFYETVLNDPGKCQRTWNSSRYSILHQMRMN